MAITATSTPTTTREPIPAGLYPARCYQMIHIGTVEESFEGVAKKVNKVRIGWELPTETRVFKEENGEQPCVISKEYTLSLHEKSALRSMLKSWRSKDFTEEEALAFDITKLLGVPCMINISHKKSADGTKTYDNISAVTPMPRGMDCPPPINPRLVFEHDSPNMEVLEALPDFIKDKVKSSDEWKARHAAPAPAPNITPGTTAADLGISSADDLPF